MSYKRDGTNFSQMKFMRVFGFLIAIYAVILKIDLLAAEYSMPATNVSVVEIKERLIAPTMDISGSVISLNDTQISSQVSGELEWIATVGTAVEKGDVIARIVPTLMEINVASAKAQLEKLKAELKFRNQEVNRFKTLANRDNTSKARLQEELSKQNMLKQDISGAQSTLRMTKFYMAQTKIRAPFSGHVVSRLSNKGEYLSMGDKVIRLVDTYRREISINAPMSLIGQLSKGQLVGVVGNQSVDLPIESIVPVGDQLSRMVEVRIDASSVDWIIGTGVSVNLPKAIPLNRIAIPRDALIIKGSQLYIFRINEDMKAEKIDVEIEAIDGAWIAIKAKLNKGDKIVIRGGERLAEGQAVNFLKL